MRRGGTLALRWEDVDLKTGLLSEKKSLEETAAGLAFKQPKTAESRRVVELPRMLVEEPARQKARQAERRLLLGPAYQSHSLVVTQEDGRPVVPSRLTITFRNVVRKAGVRPVRFHDLRHVNATLLLLAGVDTKIVASRLRHSTTAITRDLYQHLLQPMDEDAAQKIDAYVRPALGG